MTEQNGSGNSPEYPDYSQSSGNGDSRFARPSPGEQPKPKRGRRRKKADPAQPIVPTVTPIDTSAMPDLVPPGPAPQAPSAEQASAPENPYAVSPANMYGADPATSTAQSAPSSTTSSSSSNDYVNPGGLLAPGQSSDGTIPGSQTGSKSSRRPFIVVLVVIVIAAALAGIGALVGNDSSPSGSGSGSGTSPNTGSGSNPTAAPSTNVTPAPDDPQSFEEAIVEFDEFTVRGSGDREFELPEGVTNGMIEVSYNGSNYFSLYANDQTGRTHDNIMWGRSDSGSIRTNVIFGTYDYDGDWAETIEVSVSDGDDWQLTFKPITDLDELPDSHTGDDEWPISFLYNGPGETFEFTFDAEEEDYLYFTVDQDSFIDFSENIVRMRRPATVIVEIDPGPNVVTIDPGGASSWSFEKQ